MTRACIAFRFGMPLQHPTTATISHNRDHLSRSVHHQAQRAFHVIPIRIRAGARAETVTHSQHQLTKRFHVLRPSTLAWVMPVTPTAAQILRRDGAAWHFLEALLLSVLLQILFRLRILTLLVLLSPVARAMLRNFDARTKNGSFAAIVLGTCFENMLVQEHSGFQIPLPNSHPSARAYPHSHTRVPDGAPVAALVMATDPRFDGCETQKLFLQQAFVAGARNKYGGTFLLNESETRRDRLLKIISAAYARRTA